MISQVDNKNGCSDAYTVLSISDVHGDDGRPNWDALYAWNRRYIPRLAPGGVLVYLGDTFELIGRSARDSVEVTWRWIRNGLALLPYHTCRAVIIPGNHDDALGEVMGTFKFGELQLWVPSPRDALLEVSPGVFACHGEWFDPAAWAFRYSDWSNEAWPARLVSRMVVWWSTRRTVSKYRSGHRRRTSYTKNALTRLATLPAESILIVGHDHDAKIVPANDGRILLNGGAGYDAEGCGVTVDGQPVLVA